MSLIEGYPVKITGIGTAIPEHIITNDDLSRIIDTNDEWITSRTGIKQRHVVSGNEGATSLSVQAANEALSYGGLAASDIDLIISATSIPDQLYPSTACEVQGQIGASNAVAFNVVAACSGFIYAMKVAHSLLFSGTYRKALVLGCDIHSRSMNWQDRSTCILFGDGAGAMILERTEGDNEIYTIDIHSDGSKAGHLNIPLSGKNAPGTEANETSEQYVRMNGREIYKFSIKVIPNAILESLKKADLSVSELDYLIPHQANIRIVQAIGEKLKLREDQLIAELQNYGNTSAASIPIALVNALKKDKVKVPSKIAMVGFGAGLTWGISVVKFSAIDQRTV
ncbi:MAG: 3-oxoacyl-[acyl-carrier-protein] synthase 3 [bacterium]|nr:MAG: 3-oxoacyl-[acyl-carrier-protein] synthase 3 [bacterium]